MTPPDGSLLLDAGFVLISLAVVATLAFVLGRAVDRRAGAFFLGGALVWAGVTWGLADAGVLAVFDLPPRAFFVLVAGFALVAALVASSWGRALARLPFAVLIGLQAFRVVVELLIHQAVTEGVAPPQLTWTGYNLDIITGITALPVALLAARDRAPRWLLLAWNVLGAVLLGVVLVVAVLSMPTPLQQLTPDNTWVAFPPFIWLPSILVLGAVLLHAISFRKLATTAPRLATLPA